jgi:hypothetical protein
LLVHPLIEVPLAEAPRTPNFEGWDSILGNKTIDRSFSDLEISRHFAECEDAHRHTFL